VSNDIERITVMRMLGTVVAGALLGMAIDAADGWSAIVLVELVLVSLALWGSGAQNSQSAKWVFDNWGGLTTTLLVVLAFAPVVIKSSPRGRACVVLYLLGFATIVDISVLLTDWKLNSHPRGRKYSIAAATILLATMGWMLFVVLRMTVPD